MTRGRMRAGQAGFTLVETIIVLCVVGITMCFAVPAFAKYMSTSRAVDASNQLLSDMLYARWEAVTRGGRLRVGRAAAWAAGWDVMHTPAGAPDSDELVLKSSRVDGVEIAACGTVVAAIEYATSGGLVAPQSGVTFVLRAGPAPNDSVRYVVVEPSGYAYVGVQPPSGVSCS